LGKKKTRATKSGQIHKTPASSGDLQPVASELSLQCHDNSDALLSDVRQLIVEARQQTAQVVNAALTLTYWKIGDRIRREILEQQRAAYGKQIVSTLSSQLAPEFGRSFSEKNLRRMLQFAEIYPDEQIVVSLIRQLSWTHFIALIPLKDELAREFYAEMCRLERWSVRTLSTRTRRYSIQSYQQR
jgi:hypothetical protein